MEANQSELFEEMPTAVNPRGRFARVRIEKNIVQFPCSIWKDGRRRADLSAAGCREVVSRNDENFKEAIEQRLKQRGFKSVLVEFIDFVSEEYARERAQPWRRPFRKKQLKKQFALRPVFDRIYANPLVEDRSVLFGKYPDWLLVRRELKPIEKLIYGRLLFPVPPICERWDKRSGAIIGLNQGALARSIGLSRQATNERLISFQRKRLIECLGSPGAKQVTRFLWQEWMPPTCKLDGQR